MNNPTILMIRPANFGFNEETANTNTFQKKRSGKKNIQQTAAAEFDFLVDVLRASGVEVIVFNDAPEPHTPDSVFPNNWISTHGNGQIFLYPMQAPNRRLERRKDVVDYLKQNFTVNEVIDLSYFEKQDKFLEGTGSMVLDKDFKIAYACLSPRTNVDVLNEFCRYSNYKQVCFLAVDAYNKPIYHTNVLMCIGERFVVICFESIKVEVEIELLKASFAYTRKEIIEITLDQMNAFAGNMLELKNNSDKNLLVMSARANQALTQVQKNTLKKYCKIIEADISTIEDLGGGSARCMIAEVLLPPKI